MGDFVESEIHSNAEIKDDDPRVGRVCIYYHRAGMSMKQLDMPKKLFVKALERYLEKREAITEKAKSANVGPGQSKPTV